MNMSLRFRGRSDVSATSCISYLTDFTFSAGVQSKNFYEPMRAVFLAAIPKALDSSVFTNVGLHPTKEGVFKEVNIFNRNVPGGSRVVPVNNVGELWQ